MSKWKCEICESEFDNFHAQGFDNKIYCPLCFFKRENQELKKQLENRYKKTGTLTGELLYEENTKLINQQKEFIKYLEDEIKLYENDIQNFKKDYKVYFSLINDLRVSKTKIEEILQKHKEIVGVSDENN